MLGFCFVTGFMGAMLCWLTVVCTAAIHWLITLFTDYFSQDWWFRTAARDDDHWCLLNWDCSGKSATAEFWWQLGCRPTGGWGEDITFLVHIRAGHRLMAKECAFLESQSQLNVYKQMQAVVLCCYINMSAGETEVVTGRDLVPWNCFCLSLFLHLRTDSKPTSGDCLLLGTSLSKMTWCFGWKCVAPAGISLGTGRIIRRETAYESSETWPETKTEVRRGGGSSSARGLCLQRIHREGRWIHRQCWRWD